MTMQLIKTNPNTHKLRARIFAMARDAGLSSEQLHEYLPTWCSHDSLKDMTHAQADLVIKALRKITQKVRHTPDQYGKIKGLQERLKWDDKSLSGFIKHTIKSHNQVSRLSMSDASKVILGLQRICKERKL
jgi:predicted metal-dependent hydrolase